MALILAHGEHRPRIGRGVFLAPNATIIGDVEIADDASIWFGAVLRGDVGPIRIGRRTNVQDLVCIHMTGGLSGTILGSDVTVGHGAILHGCIVGDRCLIGMGSIVMDNADIGEGSVISAGSVVAARTVFPPRSLVRGTPARLIREVNEEEGALGLVGAAHYVEHARAYRSICADLPEVTTDAMSTPRPTGLFRTGRVDDEPLGRERERALDLGNDRNSGED